MDKPQKRRGWENHGHTFFASRKSISAAVGGITGAAAPTADVADICESSNTPPGESGKNDGEFSTVIHSIHYAKWNCGEERDSFHPLFTTHTPQSPTILSLGVIYASEGLYVCPPRTHLHIR